MTKPVVQSCCPAKETTPAGTEDTSHGTQNRTTLTLQQLNLRHGTRAAHRARTRSPAHIPSTPSAHSVGDEGTRLGEAGWCCPAAVTRKGPMRTGCLDPWPGHHLLRLTPLPLSWPRTVHHPPKAAGRHHHNPQLRRAPPPTATPECHPRGIGRNESRSGRRRSCRPNPVEHRPPEQPTRRTATHQVWL